MDKEKDIKEIENLDTDSQDVDEQQKVSQEKSAEIEEQTSGEKDTAEETTKEVVADTSGQSQEQSLDSEVDLGEKDSEEEDEEEHDEEIDYSNFSKEEFVELIKSLAKDDNVQKAERVAREIKPLFDEIKEKERGEALERFVADGGAEEDFDFKYDELTTRFDANYKLIRDRRAQFVKAKEEQKEANLKKKQAILEKLREFVDSEETNISFNEFKNLQNEWKDVGPVPGAYAKTLWANYNALVDRFYDNRSIYFELKELDRKKNLESKIELCERAEKLVEHENLKEAIKELNELHHEFKHIGPVPQEEQEPLWQRFKGASDAVYARRKEFVEQLKSELEENLKVKEQLAEEVQPFASFDSDRIKEWNAKTKEILDVQKKWEAVGGLPRAKAKVVNKKFWGTFKTFFNNKSAFFKKLDAQREGNLEKKKELVNRAVEIKDSIDWQKTADEFKRLQREWKEIGPVPEKYRESVYKEFKEAADHFFDKKRSKNNEVEKEFEENLKRKENICDQIEKMAVEKSDDLEKFRDLQDEYLDIGFVPRKSISKIKSRYSEVVDKFINGMEGLSNEDRQQIRIENQVNKLLSGPNADQKIHRKEQAIRKQINKVEHDIALWKNNLEFFADSKTADKLKDEFNSKIKSANNELKNLKQQLRVIRTVSD
ncbi:hypothetical protein C900_02538 [Fulvivirga imtechensis AK7]|uniref:DUF349 domain-containing protein n=1 Tax=Fulvivirga imtechensis AK7 TaxID=1237149 RepID=L8JRI1_9BACT|nr:DUF349 domain-containing protein [Fulvivirga imtechensis]ELR71475.1 hypothetical protein C900_02538 [Fulvivirga imtechensis AK7]